MYAVKIDGEVYSTHESQDEALGFVGAYLTGTEGRITVEPWEPQE